MGRLHGALDVGIQNRRSRNVGKLRLGRASNCRCEHGELLQVVDVCIHAHIGVPAQLSVGREGYRRNVEGCVTQCELLATAVVTHIDQASYWNRGCCGLGLAPFLAQTQDSMQCRACQSPGGISVQGSICSAEHRDLIALLVAERMLRGLHREIAHSCVNSRYGLRIKALYVDIRADITAERLGFQVSGLKDAIGERVCAGETAQFESSVGRGGRKRLARNIPIQEQGLQERLVVRRLVTQGSLEGDISRGSDLRGNTVKVIPMEKNLVLSIGARMSEIGHLGMNGCARASHFQHSRVDHKTIGCHPEAGVETVGKRQLLKVCDLTAIVSDAAEITGARRIEVKISLQIVEIGIQRNGLVVGVDLPVAQKRMSDGEVEDIGLTLRSARRWLREIALTLGVHAQMHYWMIDQQFLERELAVQQGLQPHAYHQSVRMQQRSVGGSLFSANGNAIEIRGQRRRLETKLLNLCMAAGGFVGRLHKLADDIPFEPLAAEHGIRTYQNQKDEA